MRLLLVRHGESEHSVRKLVAGTDGCPGLTPKGRGQASRLRDRFELDGTTADVLLSSTVPRAKETAAIIAPALRGTFTADCALCEMHVGEGDGLPAADFAARYGSFDPMTEPDRLLSPGGDSWDSFSERVSGTLDSLARRHAGKTVLAVTHAGFLVRAFLELFDVPRPGTGTRVDPDFTSITEWVHVPEGGYWLLARYNDTTHLG